MPRKMYVFDWSKIDTRGNLKKIGYIRRKEGLEQSFAWRLEQGSHLNGAGH